MKANLVTAICDMLVSAVENHNNAQGICRHLSDYRYGVYGSLHDERTLRDAYEEIRCAMRDQGYRLSGVDDYTFPVPHPEMGNEEAFFKAKNDGTLWDSETEYGRNRWAMLAHLCEWASKLPVD